MIGKEVEYSIVSNSFKNMESCVKTDFGSFKSFEKTCEVNMIIQTGMLQAAVHSPNRDSHSLWICHL